MAGTDARPHCVGVRKEEILRVLITSNFAPPHAGGVENSIRHLVLEGMRRGDQVLVVSSDWPCLPSKMGPPLPDSVRHVKYRAHASVPQPLRTLLSVLSAFRLYRRCSKDFAPDVVIARYHVNVLAARMAGMRHILYLVPGVLKYQNEASNMSSSKSAAGRATYWFNRILQKWSFALAGRLYVFSDSMQEQVVEVSPRSTATLVRPGVDRDRFFPMVYASRSESVREGAERVVLLCLGRLVRAKGFDLAIAALQRLPEHFVLNVVGDGEERASLQEMANRLGVQGRVTFVGVSDRPEDHYRKCHLFLMTSAYEPFGQTILEAAACGVPVVAFRPGPSIKTSTVAILGSRATYAEQPTPGSLAQAITQAYEHFYSKDPGSKKAIADRVHEEYSWKTLYESLTQST